MGQWSLFLEGAEQALSANYLVCLFCLGLPEGLIQDSCLTHNSPRSEKWQVLPENVANITNTSQLPGAKEQHIIDP